jgi:hypothetical protein
VCVLVYNKKIHKNKKSKLYFGDRVAVLNNFIYQTGGSNYIYTFQSQTFLILINNNFLNNLF